MRVGAASRRPRPEEVLWLHSTAGIFTPVQTTPGWQSLQGHVECLFQFETRFIPRDAPCELDAYS